MRLRGRKNQAARSNSRRGFPSPLSTFKGLSSCNGSSCCGLNRSAAVIRTVAPYQGGLTAAYRVKKTRVLTNDISVSGRKLNEEPGKDDPFPATIPVRNQTGRSLNRILMERV